MKKAILFSIVFLCTVFLPAYSQTYHPFPVSGAIWNSVGDNLFSGSEWEFRYGLYGDTVINGQTWSKVYSLVDTTLINPGSPYFGAVREDSQKRVWLNMTDWGEMVLYDFSAGVGDTIWYPTGGALCGNGLSFMPSQVHFKRVVSIDSILLENNQYRKQWHLEGPVMDDTWVEGIGSIHWYALLTPMISDITLCGDSYSFACFKDGDETLYLQNENCARCFCHDYLSIPERMLRDAREIVVSPNPARDAISVPADAVLQPTVLTIYTSDGVPAMTFDRRAGEGCTVSVSGLSQGNYILVSRDLFGTLTGAGKFIVSR